MKILFNALLSFYLTTCCVLAQDVKLTLPVGHGSFAVFDVSYSPDNKLVATGSQDGTAKLWDFETGKLIRTFNPLGDFVYAARFTGDGKELLTLSSSLNIWDVKTGMLVLDKPEDQSAISEYDISSDWKRNNGILSPDGKIKVSIVSSENKIKFWESEKSQLIAEVNYSGWVYDICFNSDGKLLLVSINKTVFLLDATTQKIIKSYNSNDNIYDVAFDPTGKSFFISNGNETSRIDYQSGRVMSVFKGSFLNIGYLGKEKSKALLITKQDNNVLVYDLGNNHLIFTLIAHKELVRCAKISPDGKTLATSSDDQRVIIWDLEKGIPLKFLQGNAPEAYSAYFSYDGKYIAVSSRDKTRILNSSTGTITSNIEANGYRVQFSPNSATLVAQNLGGNSKIFNYLTGNTLRELDGSTERNRIHNIPTSENFQNISPNGSIVVTFTETEIKVWEYKTGKLLHNLTGHKKSTNAVFSSDSKYLATYSEWGGPDFQRVKVWDVTSGELIQNVPNDNDFISSCSFSNDSKYLVVSSVLSTSIWNLSPGQLIKRISGHYKILFDSNKKMYLVSLESTGATRVFNCQTWNEEKIINGYVYSVSPNGNQYITSNEFNWHNYNLTQFKWDIGRIIGFSESKIGISDLSGKELLSWSPVDSIDWVVTHPSGLFDASPGAMNKLYFVQGLDLIDFNQLKERYYEPGLWKKIMAGEELRNVEAFTKIELPPDIDLGEVNAQGMLTIKATNRGGGIGEVNVLVNGKEVIQDARPKGSNSNSPAISITIPLTSFATQFWPGQENFIVVKAWNASHWVAGRGKMVKYNAPRKADIKPVIHVIACGISDYTGDEIDLKFAAKDAEDVAQALKLGASKLFGTEAAYIYTLTTMGTKEKYPTKTNIINTFKSVSALAKSTDVIVVYLAGHGITWGGQDGDFYYLTQDAYTGLSSAYNDPAIREKTTLSSAELVELFKSVPAQKQVLMVDACGSGKAVDNLIAKRDIPSSTLRALDRMKDRTGMHIITGCAADAVSYEASQFGQGILTYSLLEGIRGAALRDEKFIDVNQLFQYAQERVPVLVAGLGGIQTPQVFSPYGAQSFDIGEVTTEDKNKIPIAKIRPVYVRSAFINKNTLDDNLQFGKKVDEKLNDISSKGTDSELLFVNVQEYPEGCKISGIYEQTNTNFTADVKIKCGDKEQKQTIKAASTEEFIQIVISIVIK